MGGVSRVGVREGKVSKGEGISEGCEDKGFDGKGMGVRYGKEGIGVVEGKEGW